MQRLLARLWAEEGGQTLAEYGLIITLIAVAAIGVIVFFGGKVVNKYEMVNNAMPPQ